MRNDLYHASGWTKKDHKYIRKEGNRYIYPEDLRTNNEAARKAAQPAYNRKPARDVINRSGVKRVDRYVDPDANLDFRSNDIVDKYGRQRSTIKDKYSTWNVDDGATAARIRANRDRKDINKADRSNQFSEKKQSSTDRAANARSERNARQLENRKAAANGKVINPSYTLRDKDGNKIARLQSKDKVSSPNQADYKQYSKERSQEQNRKKAANGGPYKHAEAHYDSNDNYKENYYTSDQEWAKNRTAKGTGRSNFTKKQLQVKNRATAANGNIIGKNGKTYTFKQDQDYAKRNTGGKKSEQYMRDYAQNEDGSYGAKEGQYWEWTTDKHTHSSEAARKAGSEKKAYEAEVKEAVKKTKAKNKAEKEKLTKKGKQIVDKIKGAFSKKKNKVNEIEVKPIETKPIEVKPIETKPIEVKKKKRTARDILSDRGITRKEVTDYTVADYDNGYVDPDFGNHHKRYQEKYTYSSGKKMNDDFEKQYAREKSLQRSHPTEGSDLNKTSFKPDSKSTLRDYDSEWLKEVNDKWIKNKNKKKK